MIIYTMTEAVGQSLAANQDAFASGADLGIAQDNCVNFSASAAGMVQVCASMCDRATQVRNRNKKK